MRHNQLSKNVEHIGYTHQNVSYGVQPIDNVECEFFYQGNKKMSEGTMVCDVIKEKYPMACYHISDTLPTIN